MTGSITIIVTLVNQYWIDCPTACGRYRSDSQQSVSVLAPERFLERARLAQLDERPVEQLPEDELLVVLGLTVLAELRPAGDRRRPDPPRESLARGPYRRYGTG